MQVDIYSMAMIFWFICHGVRPFEGVQPELVADLTSKRGVRPSMEALNWPELSPLIGNHSAPTRPQWSHVDSFLFLIPF